MPGGAGKLTPPRAKGLFLETLENVLTCSFSPTASLFVLLYYFNYIILWNAPCDSLLLLCYLSILFSSSTLPSKTSLIRFPSSMIATSEPILSFLYLEWFSSRESLEAALNVASLLLVLIKVPSFLLILIMAAEGLPKFLLLTKGIEPSSYEPRSEPPPDPIVTADHTCIVLGGWDPRLLLSYKIVFIFNGVRRWLSLTDVTVGFC